MKRLTVLIVSCLCFHFMAQAQLEQGSVRLGPDLSFSSLKLDIDGYEFKITSIEFAVGGGYYIIDNLEIGLNIGLLSQTRDYDGFEEKENGVFIGPQVRYMINIADNIYLPLTGGFGYNSFTLEEDGDDIKFNGISFGLSIGIEYIVDNQIGIGANLGPDFGTLQDPDSDFELDISEIEFGISFNFYF